MALHTQINTNLIQTNTIVRNPHNETVGNTPLVEFTTLGKNLNPNVRVLAKAEWLNISGSVKDRAAKHIIETAIKNEQLGDGKHLIDATSGNTGIGYATAGKMFGVPVKLVMPENVSAERIKILRALGAELILTDAAIGIDGAIGIVNEMVAAQPEKFFHANQYGNPANWQAHYKHTGPEIWEQTNHQVTHFVAGVGTGGTITGVGYYLKEMSPSIKVISVQPDRPKHGIQGIKHLATAIVPAIYDKTIVDETLIVTLEESKDMARKLSQDEGLLVGLSSGAAAFAALRYAETLEEGTVVTVFPDGGFKYLSMDIWK